MRNVKLYVVVCTAIIILFFLLFFVNTNIENDYVAKIDGYNISKAEYYIYLYEQKVYFEEIGDSEIWEIDISGESAENLAKQNALKRVTLVKAALNQAKKMNITLSQDEKESLKTSLEQIYNNFSPALISSSGLTIETLIKVTEEIEILNKVYNEITKNYVLSENDFSKYFEQYVYNERNSIINIDISYIFIKSPDDKGNDSLPIATEVHNLSKETENFHKLIMEYSDDYNPNEQIIIENINKSNLNQKVIETAYKLKEEEISDIVVTNKGYYIIKNEKITVPDLRQLEENIRKEYINAKKNEIFTEEYLKWSDSPQPEINLPVWNNVSINDL